MGVILKNENKLDEMIDILSGIHHYVPSAGGDSADGGVFHQVLLGGDQLTTKRGRAAIRLRDNSTSDRDRLQGFIPVTEDWHTKVVLLEVS